MIKHDKSTNKNHVPGYDKLAEGKLNKLHMTINQQHGVYRLFSQHLNYDHRYGSTPLSSHPHTHKKKNVVDIP